jgi:hypothetical protein
LLIALGSVLLARLIRSIADRLIERAERKEQETRKTNLVASEREGALV